MAFEAKDGSRRIRLSYHYGNQHTIHTNNSDAHIHSSTSTSTSSSNNNNNNK